MYHQPKIPSMKRRAVWHDYRRPGLYMITIETLGRKGILGDLISDPYPHLEFSHYGHAVFHEEIPRISQVYPNVEVWKVCVMPDHIHLLVEVNAEFPEKRHLGSVVSGFKVGCNKAYRRMFGSLDGNGVFSRGYHDRILLSDMEAEKWKHYMDDNPRRTIMKRENPALFTVAYDADVAGRKCQTVGNRFLLDIPDKEAVIVHRAYTADVLAEKCRAWLECGERGGVLVGTAIHPKEREILHQARTLGYNIIWLRSNGFPQYYKPSGKSFDLCAAGSLLEISPWEYHTEERDLRREDCLFLNQMVEEIVGR